MLLLIAIGIAGRRFRQLRAKLPQLLRARAEHGVLLAAWREGDLSGEC